MNEKDFPIISGARIIKYYKNLLLVSSIDLSRNVIELSSLSSICFAKKKNNNHLSYNQCLKKL